MFLIISWGKRFFFQLHNSSAILCNSDMFRILFKLFQKNCMILINPMKQKAENSDVNKKKFRRKKLTTGC